MKNIFPVDLPRDFYNMIDKAPEELKKALAERTEEAVAKNEWECAQDLAFDVNDLNFAAYWLYKTRKPITKAMEGSNIEEILKSSQKTYMEVNEGVDVKDSYRVCTVGDLMMAKYIGESKDFLYSEVQEHIFGADFKFSNLESTISEEEIENLVVKNLGGGPKINVTKSEYRTLVSHNDRKYDLVELANNHILDCGADGINITIDALKEDGIDFIGAYENEEASKEIFTTKIGDIKVGFINHTFSVNGKEFPVGKEWIVDMTEFHSADKPDVSKIIEQIKEAKASCDLVFLVLHWGLEHEMFPHPAQRKWAQEFAEAGADVIIGHHPHVIQPYELVTTRDSKKVPVFYSLGNLTPPTSAAFTVLSYIANFTVARQADGKAIITELAATPTVFVEQIGETTRGLLLPLDKLNNLELDNDTREYVEEIKKYSKLIFGDDYLVDGLPKMKVMSSSKK